MKAISIEIAGLSKESKEKLIRILEETGCIVASICTMMSVEKTNHLMINTKNNKIYYFGDSEFAKYREEIELDISVDEIKDFL